MTAPTYTYSGDPSSSDKDAVRFWVQDTGPDVWLLSDQEILFTLDQYSNTILAAAQCCRSIAAKFGQKVNKRVGDLSINYSDKVDHYLALAQEFDTQGSISGLAPYAGGISKSDMCKVASNTDRVKPPFREGQFDNRQALNGLETTDPDFGER